MHNCVKVAYLCVVCFHFQGTNIKDVVLPESAPTTLLLDKHIAFIVSYSKKTDDYVCGHFVGMF